MNLHLLRKNNKLGQFEVVERLQAVEPRMTVPIYSVMERGVVNPTAKQTAILREMFKVKDAEPEVKEFYKLTVKVPVGLMDEFTVQMAKQGYKGVTEWLLKSIARFVLMK